MEPGIGGGAGFFQVSEEGGVEIVVGIRRGLLAGSAGFLVVGQKIRVPKEDARRIDLIETPRPAPRPPDPDLFAAIEPSYGIALRAAVHLDGAEVDKIGRVFFGHQEFRRKVRPEDRARGRGPRTPVEEGRPHSG